MKPELIQTALAADGRAHDVGTDRRLANNLNRIIDYRTARQGSFLWNNAAAAGLGPFGTNNTWAPMFVGQIYLGMTHNNATVKRQITFYPFWRSDTGGVSAWLRITLTDQKPTLPSGVVPFLNLAYLNSKYLGNVSQTEEWTTSSATWGVATSKTIDVVKRLDYGFAWIVVEGANAAECRGFTWLEGPRVSP